MRYWIAINGASLAMKNPVVTPTPSRLIGFLTFDEAQRAQNICLTAPIPEVKRFMRSIEPDIAAGRIVAISPANPEPPTRGPTIWLDEAA